MWSSHAGLKSILRLKFIDVRMVCFLFSVEDALLGRIALLVINHHFGLLGIDKILDWKRVPTKPAHISSRGS